MEAVAVAATWEFAAEAMGAGTRRGGDAVEVVAEAPTEERCPTEEAAAEEVSPRPRGAAAEEAVAVAATWRVVAEAMG